MLTRGERFDTLQERVRVMVLDIKNSREDAKESKVWHVS